MARACVSCDRVRLPGGPARCVLCRRRDSSGRQLNAELDIAFLFALNNYMDRLY